MEKKIIYTRAGKSYLIMAKVLLDTNFLMIPGQFGVDIFSEISRILVRPELFTLDLNTAELEKILKEGSQKEKKAARIALILIKSKGVSIVKTKSFLNRIQNPKDIDSFIVECAKDGYIVATQDAELRKRLPPDSEKIVLRKKDFLALTN
jgi:rRNA-processing protein FCF1